MTVRRSNRIVAETIVDVTRRSADVTRTTEDAMKMSADAMTMTEDVMMMTEDATTMTEDATMTGNGIGTTVIATMIAIMTIAEEGESLEL